MHRDLIAWRHGRQKNARRREAATLGDVTLAAMMSLAGADIVTKSLRGTLEAREAVQMRRQKLGISLHRKPVGIVAYLPTYQPTCLPTKSRADGRGRGVGNAA